MANIVNMTNYPESPESEELVRAGAALDLQDDKGKTALMWAAQRASSTEVVKELVRAGAALDLQL